MMSAIHSIPKPSLKLDMCGLGKRYRGEVWGLRGVDLELRPGILGLLGPNGAGKSTLMRMLATITRPTEGKITWNGVDISEKPDTIRTVMGYLPQDFGIYPHLNAIEFLEYLAAIKGISGRAARKRVEEVLVTVNLTQAAQRPLGGYSGGMKQRVGIAQALLNDPQILIVDEPTVGLDPEERVRFRSLLTDLSGERIVILSTHIVSDVEATATDIAILNKGSLLIHSFPEALLAKMKDKVWEWTIPSGKLPALKQSHLVTGSIRREEGLLVRVAAQDRPDPAANAVSPTLEDAYLFLIANSQASPS